MYRRRVLAVACITTLVLAPALLSGCRGEDRTGDGGDTSIIRLSGSGAVTPLLHLLSDAYPEADVSFTYLPGLHSSGGIDGVAEGSLDIGMVSRGLEAEEERQGLEVTFLSRDALAIVVHPTVAIDDLSTEQVRDVYGGVFENWSEVGGADLPILVLDRQEGESAKIVLREHVIGDVEVVEGAVSLDCESDMLEAARSTPGAVGYVSLGCAVSEDAFVTVVALDGVEPTVENVEGGSYDVVRTLGVVTRSDAPAAVRDFIGWATGPVATDLMTRHGFAPYGQ